jgi:hypothetical protein
MKASPTTDAPKHPKKSTSRVSPKNRDNNVRELTRDNRPDIPPIKEGKMKK